MYFSEVTFAAPVPPVPPAILITSAPAFATPTPIVPIPSEDTNFTTTLTLAALARHGLIEQDLLSNMYHDAEVVKPTLHQVFHF